LGAKAEPMAGNATVRRRWVVPSALLVTLLASFGKDWFTATYLEDAGEGDLWQCRECKWVEWWPQRSQAPLCYGATGPPHAETETELVEDENLKPSDGDGPHRFK